MPRRVLVVDDNPINRQLLMHALESDYDVLEAGNGREALELMRRHCKSLSAVLLDIMMPEMDGYQVLQAAGDDPLLAQIPIIAVTGSEDEETRVKVLSLGAGDFILKPFSPDIVRHCVRNNIALRETASILNAIQKDKLTGLLNREAFFERVNAALADREPGGYILSCFDIDNFKLINDQYGAAEGDRLLRQLGGMVKADMDALGGFAARISADNFAALIPIEKKDESVLQNMQVAELTPADKRSLVFSVGRYVITDLSLPASAIYDRAYLAKQSVKGRYDQHMAYFDEAMLEKLVRDQQIAGDMEAALTNRQFQVWFQPQYNQITGALTGAEALVRWNHPERGMISPGEFIPLFEQNGFIYELDKYVWRETCRLMREWLDRGLSPVPVSVNISRYDVFRADLLETVSGLVKEFDLPIDMLRLEITESAFASSTEVIVDIVMQLIAMGFTVEIDDFGSGYSSLNTLKNVPAQVLKLDMRFLEDREGTQRGGNILESIVRMAKWLGMSVIAEGVETKAQGDFLKSIGCSDVQGFFFARPMPSGDYEALMSGAVKDRGLSRLETTENYDNSTFWNPQSMDSLIFNSYVGAACIFEYHHGSVELLRATDKLARLLCGDSMTVDALLRLELTDYLEAGTARQTMEMVDAAAKSREDTEVEFTLVDLPGRPGETHMRSVLRVIASADERYLLYCVSQDITEQRLLERRERLAAKQLQVVMDNISCGITATVMHDGSVEYLLANDKYYELLGYTREQYLSEIGADGYATVFPADRSAVAASAQRVRATGAPASLEYRALRRDGGVIWLRSLLSMTGFEDVDRPVQLCTYADITSEKHAAQELLDNLPVGAALYEYENGKLSVIHLNKRYWELVDRAPVDYSALSVLTAVHPDDRAEIATALNSALRDGGDMVCDIRVMFGQGEYRPFHIVGRIIGREAGKYSIYASYTPISDETMSISEMLPVALAAVMASSPELTFVKDRNLRYICCSRAFAEMMGLESEKDVVGKTDAELVAPDLAEMFAADDRALFESGESIIDKVDVLTGEDGRSRYSSTSKYLLYSASGVAVGLYGTGHDITESREVRSRENFLINNIPGGIAVYEGKWSTLESIRLTYFSDGFCRIFGYARDEYSALGADNPTGLIAPDYLPELVRQIEALVTSGTPIDLIYQAYAKGGRPIWIHIKAIPGESHGDSMTVYALLFDVTEHQNALERLRVSEEENRLAIMHSKNVVCRYDIAARSLRISSGINPIFGLSTELEDVPYGQIRDGSVSPETAEAYAAFYEGLIAGEKGGSLTFQRSSSQGWRWVSADASTIFSRSGAPVSAVITVRDVTETFEKDAAYNKWMQSLRYREPESYSLFRCCVSQNTVFDATEGALINHSFTPGPFSFNSHTEEYVEACVYEADKARFTAFMNVDSLLEKYYRGERILSLEFREKQAENDYRWLRLTIDLVEYAHSADVEAYLLFEDIDQRKRTELLTLERAETDPLTGVYNRAAFAEKADALIRDAGRGAQYALMLLDIDGFKLVNDAFGHGAGDQALIEIAHLLQTVTRRDDLVGRLGGDEFVIFLGDIPGEQVAATKARQICDVTRRAFNAEVQISGSVGIAVYPHDGGSFAALYKKADEALYHVKDSGRDNFAFFHEDMSDELPAPAAEADGASHPLRSKKRRMLIVDDNKVDCEMLANMFRSEYNVEKARDGASALIRLRHYGSAISVVLLDLFMPGMDGFAVLERMQQIPDLQSIPVIVVSGADDPETSLRAIRCGAGDFVTKPVDADVLRIRVKSAISKADNERLRAKNSYLELQSSEALRYRTVLERIGLAVVEMDWRKAGFTYSPSLSHCLWGKYDGRSLWHILMSDMVADAQTVKTLQQLSHSLANDRCGEDARLSARLKSAGGGWHWFEVNLYKLANEYGLTDKIILTFNDVGTEPPQQPGQGTAEPSDAT